MNIEVEQGLYGKWYLTIHAGFEEGSSIELNKEVIERLLNDINQAAIKGAPWEVYGELTN